MQISFRDITMDDMVTLHEWVFRPHVRRWWDDPYDGLDDIIAEFTSDQDYMWRTIGVLAGRDIGYFQAWWDLSPAGEVGIDQFLADEADLGRGIGSAAVLAFTSQIFERMPHINRITLDPHPDNPRAFRAYEKAGFVHSASRSTPDKWLMEKERPTL